MLSVQVNDDAFTLLIKRCRSSFGLRGQLRSNGGVRSSCRSVFEGRGAFDDGQVRDESLGGIESTHTVST